MLRNRLSFVLLAAGCLAAAAAGGYYAVRLSAPATTTTAATPAQGIAEAAPAKTVPAEAAEPAASPATAEQAAASETPGTRKPAERVRPAPVERMAAAEPARRRATERAVEETRRAPRQMASAAPVYGPIAGSHPIGANGWPALEQELPSRNPAPPPAADPAPAPSADAMADADADLKPIEQFVISADSVIGLVIDSPLSSETARVEDEVNAHVSRDVKVGDKVAIPAGTAVRGTVIEVDHGGKFRDRARLGIQFDTIRMADGSELPIRTDTIFRDGEAPGDAASRKIGASAVAGTILGAIFGGARGALIGGATGAAGGTAMVEAGGQRPATFPPGATVTVRLRTAVTVTNEK